VLQIPIQSVISHPGITLRSWRLVAKGPERRELKVGDANDEYMEVLDGVADGEFVVMNPRTHFSKELSALESRLAARLKQSRKTGHPGTQTWLPELLREGP
jgi:HlyD family secretion protein